MFNDNAHSYYEEENVQSIYCSPEQTCWLEEL